MTTCKQCGLEVRWVKIEGKWSCHNADGSDHWDLCSKTRFEKVRSEGKLFQVISGKDNITAEGYRSGRKTQYTMLRPAKSIKGKNYIDPHCDCGIPPWETCKHSMVPNVI